MFLVVCLGLLASVTYSSERVVMVEAALADPIALFSISLSVGLLLTAFAIFRFDGCFFIRGYEHMLRLALEVVT